MDNPTLIGPADTDARSDVYTLLFLQARCGIDWPISGDDIARHRAWTKDQA